MFVITHTELFHDLMSGNVATALFQYGCDNSQKATTENIAR
jgi:hypothetical protein